MPADKLKYEELIHLLNVTDEVANPIRHVVWIGKQENNMKRNQRETGFTLLEMVVVIAILASLAGSVVLSMEGAEEMADEQIARSEMMDIRKALLQFRQDTGHFPVPASPADFSALYEITSEAIWNIDTGRGWRGPYLSGVRDGLVDIGDNLTAGGAGDPALGSEIARQSGVADPFAHPNAPDADGCTAIEPPNDGCLLEWRDVANEEDRDLWGRPYLLFDLADTQRARIVSLGANGRYECDRDADNDCDASDVTITGDDLCTPRGDDIVVCLLR
jgi:prepilin-type N-terminal cleavage/methylation domain-containing protein